MFPPADRYLDYLRDYQQKLGLNVQFNTEIRNVKKEVCENVPDGHIYTMQDQNGVGYRCGLVNQIIYSSSKPFTMLIYCLFDLFGSRSDCSRDYLPCYCTLMTHKSDHENALIWIVLQVQTNLFTSNFFLSSVVPVLLTTQP